MDALDAFRLEVNQVPHLPVGGREMHAILTITAQGLGAAPGEAAPRLAEVILVDCSGSMGWPPTKLAAAKRAVAAAIDVLPEAAYFAVVAGEARARMVYPPGRALAAATLQHKQAAKRAVKDLKPNDGTAIGTWLTLARELLDGHAGEIRHALLLTDGQNVDETPEQLERALNACEGRFYCDARGIGGDWEPKELKRITQVLRGEADAVREPSNLADDFRALTQGAMRKVVPDLRIRISPRLGSQLRFVKQVYPTLMDITESKRDAGNGAVEVHTGAWGDEARHYQVCLDLDPAGRPVAEDLQAARVDLAVVRTGEQAAAGYGKPSPIVVHWTRDLALSSRVDPRMEHYTGHERLRKAVDDGCAAYDRGDRQTAAREWERAYHEAKVLDNEKILGRLEPLIDVDAERNVRLKEGIRREDLLGAESSSIFSTPFSGERPVDPPGGDPEAGAAQGATRTCSNCGHVSPATYNFCMPCGQRLDDDHGVDP